MYRTPTTFAELIAFFLQFINYLIALLFAVIFVFVVWKLIDTWVINAADSDKQQEGRTLLIVAVLVLVVMVSTWGIIHLVRQSLFGA